MQVKIIVRSHIFQLDCMEMTPSSLWRMWGDMIYPHTLTNTHANTKKQVGGSAEGGENISWVNALAFRQVCVQRERKREMEARNIGRCKDRKGDRGGR